MEYSSKPIVRCIQTMSGLLGLIRAGMGEYLIKGLYD